MAGDFSIINGILPAEWIEEVRVRNDIVEVVGDYLSLKKSGAGYFGLCPFHGEKTASFSVEPVRQFYHCFGCGAGGNVISFVMEIEGLEFIDAVKHLADRVGMAMPEIENKEEYQKVRDKRQRLFELNKSAAMYYYNMLSSKEGEIARNYLNARGINSNIVKSFGIGYAPIGWQNIHDFLLKAGYLRNELIESGIVVNRDDSKRIYDRFRNRIMIPIINTRGMVEGFGGRVMDDSTPKYLNSPESPVFSKSKILYGLNMARKRMPIESLIMVEGYMDVITLYRYGFYNAVASLGTSLTEDQAGLARRHVEDVYIAYDGDAAGNRATLRGMEVLTSRGLNVRILKFPDKMDPDDTLRKHGSEHFKKLIAKSVGLVDFKLDFAAKDFDLTSSNGKLRYASEAAKILAGVLSPIERDAHLRRIEDITGFSTATVRMEIDRLRADNQKDTYNGVKMSSYGNNSHRQNQVRITTEQKNSKIMISAEERLAHIICRNTGMAELAVKSLVSEDFTHNTARKIFESVKYMIDEGISVNPDRILDSMSEPSLRQSCFSLINKNWSCKRVDIETEGFISIMKKLSLERRLNTLNIEIEKMDKEGTNGENSYAEMIRERMELLSRIKFVIKDRDK